MNNYPNILPNVQSCPSSVVSSTTSNNDSYKNLSSSQYASMQSSLTINDGNKCSANNINNVTQSQFYSDKYAQYLAKKKSPNLRKC